MKNILFFIGICSVFTFFSCDNTLNEEPEVLVEEITLEEEVVIEPTSIAYFKVTGMMCQKGCGATVRKGLYDTGAVSEVNVELGDSISEVAVYYDDQKVSPQEMEDVISGLADGMYQAQIERVEAL